MLRLPRKRKVDAAVLHTCHAKVTLMSPNAKRHVNELLCVCVIILFVETVRLGGGEEEQMGAHPTYNDVGK